MPSGGAPGARARRLEVEARTSHGLAARQGDRLEAGKAVGRQTQQLAEREPAFFEIALELGPLVHLLAAQHAAVVAGETGRLAVLFDLARGRPTAVDLDQAFVERIAARHDVEKERFALEHDPRRA